MCRIVPLNIQVQNLCGTDLACAGSDHCPIIVFFSGLPPLWAVAEHWLPFLYQGSLAC